MTQPNHSEQRSCLWPTGTAGSGPRSCGKPAKATAETPYTDARKTGVIPVCGVHANASLRRNYLVTLLADCPWEDCHHGPGCDNPTVKVASQATPEQDQAHGH